MLAVWFMGLRFLSDTNLLSSLGFLGILPWPSCTPWLLLLSFSPTSQAPEVYRPCLDCSVPSGPLRVMFMKAAAQSVPPLSIQLRLKTRQWCVSRNTTQDLTHSVPTWTWTYGLQQPTGMQTSLFRGTRAIVETYEKESGFKNVK